MIDGEGGDEVLGVAAHRVAPLTLLRRQPRPLRWPRYRPLFEALSPAPVRVRRAHRRWHEQPLPWLRPVAKDALVSALTEVERVQPLSFRASVHLIARRRSPVIGAHNRRILAAQRGVELVSPLLDPDVVRALARDGGVLGRGDRTAVLRRLVPDLLPDAVLARTTKARFTRAFMGAQTRAFATSWTGVGIDPELVDAEELRRSWLSEAPPAPTAALLQAAWLAGRRRAARSIGC